MRYRTVKIGNVPTVPKPADREKCAWCGKPLRIRYEGEFKTIREPDEKTVFALDCNGKWRYDSYGNFCSQPCAVKFANHAFRRGFRKLI